MTGGWRDWLARTGFRRRDLLLAVPLGVIAAVGADLAWRPAQPGVVSWAALAVSGSAIALYLGLLAWDRKSRQVGERRSEGTGGRRTR